MTRVLVVDDSALMRRFLGRLLAAADDFEVELARDGVEALDMVQSFRPDVITLDIEMPNMDGLEFLDRLMLEFPCPVVMVSALTDHGADITLQALELGAVDFVAKPQGTISLHADELGPVILETVRNAARVKIKQSRRLADRLKHRAAGRLPATSPHAARSSPALPVASAPAAGMFVIVGTSTGGPPALDALLSRLPADFGWPILIAQHMPQAFTGPLSRRLDRLCALSVVEVTAPIECQPGGVYIGRGDADLVLTRRGTKVVATAVPSDAAFRWHPSVDRLVQSAIESVGAERIVGVLMTGMGDDGAASMTMVKQAGGRTIAEAESTAVVWGMPGELVRRGGAEQIAPLDSIAVRLLELSPWR